MPDFIKLPSERVQQLRTLSRVHDKPIADLIGDYIADQQAKGFLPKTVPGIEVIRDGDTVKVSLQAMADEVREANDRDLKLYSKIAEQISFREFGSKAAQEFAQQLRAAATPKVPVAADFGVARRGMGVTIKFGDEQRALARSVALDLANVVEDAAK